MKTVTNIHKVLVGKHEGQNMEEYADGTHTTEMDLKETGQDSACAASQLQLYAHRNMSLGLIYLANLYF